MYELANPTADVVSVVTKIRILKQITTVHSYNPHNAGCICSNKDKNFKANHNSFRLSRFCSTVVSAVTKIRILKQITTFLGMSAISAKLYL